MNLGGSENSAGSQKNKFEAKEHAKKPPLFISKERDHKFDLLLHLVANLRQPLVVCGPTGVGKSHFLSHIEASKSQHWLVVTLTSERRHDIEGIFDAIVEQLNWHDSNRGLANQELVTQRVEQLAAKKQILVLVVDNAGDLSPGIITALTKFCEKSRCVRLITAMTSDQLNIKQSTDPCIDDFHVVDIPSLNEQQCGDYLRSLSGWPTAALSFKAINPLLIQTVYQQTDGIPGNILDMLPALGASGAGFIIKSQVLRFKNTLFVLVGLCAILFGAFLWIVYTERDNADFGSSPSFASRVGEKKTEEEPLTSEEKNSSGRTALLSEASSSPDVITFSEADATDNAMPVPLEAEVVGLPLESIDQPVVPRDTESVGQGLGTDDLAPPPAAIDDDISLGSEKLVESSSGEGESGLQDNVSSGAAGNGTDAASPDSEEEPRKQDSQSNPAVEWIVNENPRRYTIQLIALSSEKGIKKLIDQYPQLDPIGYFRSPRQSGDLYPLIYGNFSTMREATEAQKAIPSKLGKGWVRRFSSVQQEIKKAEN